MNKQNRFTTEKLMSATFGTTLILFTLMQAYTVMTITVDTVLMVLLGCVFFSIYFIHASIRKHDVFKVFWYVMYISLGFWLIIKVLYFNETIYGYLLGCIGICLGIFIVRFKTHFFISLALMLGFILITITYTNQVDDMWIYSLLYLITGLFAFVVWNNFKDHQDEIDVQHMLLDYASEGFALHDIIVDEYGQAVDYRFVMVNHAFECLTGLKKYDIIGKTVLEVLPETEDYWIKSYGKVALDYETLHFKNYSRALEKHFSVSAFPVVGGRFATLFTDITELLDHEYEMQEAKKYVEMVSESKTEFLKEINHQIRNPLNGLMGVLQIYSEDGDEALLEHVFNECKRINNTINRISKYLEALNVKYVFKDKDLIKHLKVIMKDYNCRIESQLTSENIVFDATILKKILDYLIGIDANDKRPLLMTISDMDGLVIELKDPELEIHDLSIEEINQSEVHDSIFIKNDLNLSITKCRLILRNAGGDLKIEKSKGSTEIKIYLPHRKLGVSDY